MFIYRVHLLQVGKALFDGQLLDVHFTRSFYKHILGAKVTYHDIEAIDPDYFKNLKWMLEVCSLPTFLLSPSLSLLIDAHFDPCVFFAE